MKKLQGKGQSVKIIPLGGLEQIGMNITAFEYEDSIIVVDCGLSFPDDDMLGIDMVIPDVTYLKDNIEKYLNKTSKELDCDIAGFSQQAISNFLTISDWDNYDWPSKYSNANFDVNVSFDIVSSLLFSGNQ